jgi:hypothetical protein
MSAGTAWGSPSLPNASAAAKRTASQSSPSAWMSAGTAWGSPRSPNASAAARRTSRSANPPELYERGHGRSAYLHQRLRCRTANIQSLSPSAWMSAGTAGVPIFTNASAAARRTFSLRSPSAWMSAGTAWGSPSLPNASAAAARTAQSLSPSAWMSGGTAWGSPSLPNASAAAKRTFSLRSRSAWMSAGTAGVPIFPTPPLPHGEHPNNPPVLG